MNLQADLTLSSAIEQFMATLEAQGKHPRTLYTYCKDCEQILAYFGPDKKVSNILPVHVARFFKSEVLLKLPKTGQHRAPATFRKTQGVFRMLLTWAMHQGALSTLPWPKKAPSSQASSDSAVS